MERTASFPSNVDYGTIHFEHGRTFEYVEPGMWRSVSGDAEIEWDDISNKPTEYPPSAHGHEIAEINGLQDALDSAGGTPAWGDVTGKPTEFPPEDHTHEQSDIDGLELRLDAIEGSITDGGGFVDAPNDTKLYGRQSEAWAEVVIPEAGASSWDEIADKPTEFPPESHNQSWSTITDTPTDYPPSSHGHAWGEITGKPTEFPPEDHTHVVADITDFDPADYQPVGDYATTTYVDDSIAAIDIPDQLPHGSVSGSTLRWNDTDDKWEENIAVKIPYGADNGDLQVTYTTITPHGAIYNRRGDGSGLSLGISQISPMKNGTANNGEVDLGGSSHRFKNAYFTETVTANKFVGDGSQLTNLPDSGGSVDLSDYSTTAEADAKYQLLGNYALVGASYTKAESDSKWQPKGSYQPSGNYALVGASYTKAESDAKYELKGAGYNGSDAVKLTGNQEIGGIKTFSSDIRAKANVYAYYGSDERLKDEIAPMPIGLIDAIDPSTWKWKEDGRSSGGVIAQQLQKAGLDDWVREAPNGDLGVDYNALIGMLIAEVIELKKQINER